MLRKHAIAKKLQDSGIRPTRQRLLIAGYLFDGHDKHFRPEWVFKKLIKDGYNLSLATVYNNLNHFFEAGLITQVNMGTGRGFFDTNTSHHHHFYDEKLDQLFDIDPCDVALEKTPTPPNGQSIEKIEVIFHIKPS